MTTAAVFAAGAVAGGSAAAVVSWRLAEARAARYGRLFSFAMHEFNTPVTALNMTIINLLSGVFGEVPAPQVKWLEMARDQVTRLTALVGETRDLVHMELHRELLSAAETASPRSFIEEALKAMRPGFEHAAIELRAEIPADLADVRVDPDRAARSLASLLFHARKFRVGGPVTLRAARRGGSVACEVGYEGQNLDPVEAQRSLDLFYPARERKDQVLSATGLGLGLIRAVTLRVGGDLEMSVDKGRTRLTLLFPVNEGKA